MKKKNKFYWTNEIIQYEKMYDDYGGHILSGTQVEQNLNLLRQVADTEDPSRYAGYAAYLLSMFYDGEDQKFVPKNTELHKKYLDIACRLNETDALIDRICENDDSTSDEDDEQLKQILSGPCNRPHSVWLNRSILRRFSSRHGWQKTNVVKNFFLRRYFLLKAWTTVPKHKYFDSLRKKYRGRFLKSLIPLFLLIILIIVIVLGIIGV